MSEAKIAKITPELLASAGTEQALQTAYFAWLTPLTFHPSFELFKLIYAVPSGGERARIIGTMMKASGTRAGVWDISLAFPRGPYHYGYIEMKRPKYKNNPKQGLSDAQIEFGKLQLAQGAFMRVAFGWEEARDYTLEYFNLGPYQTILDHSS